MINLWLAQFCDITLYIGMGRVAAISRLLNTAGFPFAPRGAARPQPSWIFTPRSSLPVDPDGLFEAKVATLLLPGLPSLFTNMKNKTSTFNEMS